MKKKKILFRILLLSLVIFILVGGCAIYVSDYYRADAESIASFSQDLSIDTIPLDGAIAYGTGNESKAFIFYPGGKVEYTAYAPLMQLLAKEGILCIVVEMPFNLAVLDGNAADEVREQFPSVDSWYIGGHSLGGLMAATHVSQRTEVYEGLVLLGAYSTEDISGMNIPTLSIYGSEDGVLNREKYLDCRSNLPDNFTEIIIEGGCHAYFGMYGEQDGDGTPTISPEEQINVTAQHISVLINGPCE